MAASAGPVEGLLDQVGKTVAGITGGGSGSGGGSGGGGGAAGGGGNATVPTAGTPPSYTPPAHGTNPHGSGTVGVVDVTPDSQEPLPYEPGGGSEDVVVGRSHGEQSPSGYRGHVTLLALLGNEVVGVQTQEGESSNGPLGPLNDALDDVCADSGNQLCLTVLGVDSRTTSSGSSNSFQALGAEVGSGANQLSASAGSSSGSIYQDGSCQTASGSSSVVEANAFGALAAEALSSSSSAQSCADGSSSQSNDSRVLALNGSGLPVPAEGCEDGTPNAVFDLALLATVCNAHDSSADGGSQLAAPYGVREGLSVFALPVLGEIVKGTTGASESHAVAPAAAQPEAPDGVRPGRPDGGERGGPDGPDGGERGGLDGSGEPARLGEPGAPGRSGKLTAGPLTSRLPLTGGDLLTLAAIGIGLAATGMALMAVADRRRHAAH